jgi:signal transduction histidine kinase
VIIAHRSAVPQTIWNAESRALGESIARTLGKAAQLDLRSSDRPALRHLALETIKSNPIQSVTFKSADGMTLAQAEGPGPATLTIEVPVTDEGIAWRTESEPSQVIGSVALALSTIPMKTPLVTVGQQLSYVLAGIFALSAVLATMFIKNAFAHVRQMLGSLRRITSGEIDCMVPSSQVPLFQGIATALNTLLERIRNDQKHFHAVQHDLSKMVEELDRKLASRTAQLEAANGRLSGEIAEKEDFLRAISHDLNAPLRNIGGMVAMLLVKSKEELSEEAQGRLDRIKKNVDVETDLINELLELSRIKSKQRVLSLVETESLIWELRGMFENDLKTRNIELVLETSLPPLYAERARIRQIFQNLIDNAIKYMGDRPVREIRLGCRLNVAEAEFYVRDTGVGIHPDDVQKVFYVFRRGRGELTHKVPGKGVGLACVKSIVETYSGRIWAESQLDAGTIFRFTINGKFVPAVSGQIPDELQGQTVPMPTLAAKAA